jgi:hypothetical protein
MRKVATKPNEEEDRQNAIMVLIVDYYQVKLRGSILRV